MLLYYIPTGKVFKAYSSLEIANNCITLGENLFKAQKWPPTQTFLRRKNTEERGNGTECGKCILRNLVDNYGRMINPGCRSRS